LRDHSGMEGQFLEGISFACWHQFSWPRRTDDGGYYQVCLRCGAEYSYDWGSMRRLKRLHDRSSQRQPEGESAEPERKPCGRSHWVPRERRLKLHVPVLFREKGKTEWLHGTTENISRSGLLLQSPSRMARDAAVEMIFEMPEEISGQRGSRVLCTGSIARWVATAEKSDMIAVSIGDYEFIEEQKAV
jgi:hypothetical protein